MREWAAETPNLCQGAPVPQGNITFEWRGSFTNREIHALHAEAFQTRLFDESEWDWLGQVKRHSLGWVVARSDGQFVGFLNVLWDGFTHAFIEDVMVDAGGAAPSPEIAGSCVPLRCKTPSNFGNVFKRRSS